MNSEEAYSIKLAGEINVEGGRTFFVEKYIKNGEYQSNVFSIELGNIIQITGSGNRRSPLVSCENERSPIFQDDTLFYVKYSKDNETLLKLRALSEPEEICRFRKIKKYIVTPQGIFVIGLKEIYRENLSGKNEKPFATNRIKYRFNGEGLLRERYSLYLIAGTAHKIYSGDFDVVDVTYNGGRLVIETTEENDDYGLSDLYEINIQGQKIKRITRKSGVINGYSVSGSGRIAVSMHEDLNPWEINNIVYPEDGQKLPVGNDSNDSILTDLFFAYPYKIKYSGDVLYVLAQTKSTSNIYKIEDDKVTQITNVRGKILNFDVAHTSGVEKLVYAYSTPEHPCIVIDEDSYDINNGSAGIEPEAREMAGGEYFFMLKDRNAPTIVFVHGGPQTAYGYLYYIEFQFLYSNGYNILYANPPGSTGYGQDYEKECVGDWGNKDFEYIKSAMKDVTERYGVVDNFAITGGSYGGFMTNWIVTHSNIFKCGISERSISNMLSMIGTSDIGFWFNTLQLNISDPYSREGIRKLMEYSPISYVKNAETPLLLITGEEDFRCPIEQAEQFYTALKLNNVDAELVRYQGDNHEHARSGIPTNMIDRLKRKLAWLDKYMKK